MKGFLERSLSVWHKAGKLRPNIEEVGTQSFINNFQLKTIGNDVMQYVLSETTGDM